MKIENTLTATAVVTIDPTEEKPYRVEAVANIYNGSVAEITNGHVQHIVEEGLSEAQADFSDYNGVRNHSFFGNPDRDTIIFLVDLIESFCAEVRSKTYSITIV